MLSFALLQWEKIGAGWSAVFVGVEIVFVSVWIRDFITREKFGIFFHRIFLVGVWKDA